MPWSRLRTGRSGDTTQGLRRHSTIDPLSFQNHDGHSSHNNALRLGYDAPESVKTPSPLRNSFEPSAVEQATSSAERAQSPTLLDQPHKRQRFSLLKYRHASDPQVNLPLSFSNAYRSERANRCVAYQISKTARDHELALVPPMPAGKFINWRAAFG